MPYKATELFLKGQMNYLVTNEKWLQLQNVSPNSTASLNGAQAQLTHKVN